MTHTHIHTHTHTTWGSRELGERESRERGEREPREREREREERRERDLNFLCWFSLQMAVTATARLGRI